MTQQSDGHTPTPWRFGNTGSDIIMILGGPSSAYVCTVQIEQYGGGFIARAMEPERRANAAFIVEAVNNHARLTARVEELEKALERSMVAIDDWLNCYASDLCDPVRVEEAEARIGEYGTLSYIANVQEQNRRALTPRSSVEGK